MIVLDANLLLYAYDAASPHHAAARAWLEKTFSGEDPVGLPWQTIGAFLRIVTNTRLPGNRWTPEEAIAIVDEWLQQPNVRVLAAGDSHWSLLRLAVTEGQAHGALITDAQLAALAVEYGGTLYTTDRDFARFPGLRWTNPLSRA
ncbi:type II toxin-antitoxin system VapC family toxin [Paracidobacterium acidisoli]|uniref:Ribonuclease VapC n=1 Tax=Paracidobacterium acidisoli TaxID=2303751 RepID=A0A372IKJ5_9BACT|nr:type II toxin-antitoxin system VapC family toxin [Paracidobacterium acidisoli]